MIKKIKKLLIIFMLSFSLFTITSCSKPSVIDKEKFSIVTTLYPNYEFINAILEGQTDIGKEIEVILIVPYGTDSHNYDPSVSDYLTIKNADLFIYTSDEMEPWVDGLDLPEEMVFNIYEAMVEKYEDFEELQNLQADEITDHEHKHDHGHNHSHEHNDYQKADNFLDAMLVWITNFLSYIFPHEHNHAYDPHFWTNMLYAEYMVEVIFDKLKETIPDPDNTKIPEMEINKNNYIKELRRLDKEFMKVSSLAKDKTLFFGSPFAFYYFTNRYELDYVLTYSTCSTEIDPSILVVLEVIEEMKHHNAKVIFSKELTSTDACDKISEYTNATVLELHSGHNISAKDAGQTSFLQIMQKNVENLAIALNVDINLVYENTEEGGCENVN